LDSTWRRDLLQTGELTYYFSVDNVVESFTGPAGFRANSVIPEPLVRVRDLPYDEWADMWHDRDIDEARALFEMAGVLNDYQFTIIIPLNE